MILPVVKYGTPVLRQKGTPIEAVTSEIKHLIADMFETMYATKGIGLAAQQVGKALQLTVLDLRGVEDRPSTLELDGKPADVEKFMPLVLINPEIKSLNDPVAGPEGCLSFPELYGDVLRPESVAVKALNEKGKPIEFRCGGLLAGHRALGGRLGRKFDGGSSRPVLDGNPPLDRSSHGPHPSLA